MSKSAAEVTIDNALILKNLYGDDCIELAYNLLLNKTNTSQIHNYVIKYPQCKDMLLKSAQTLIDGVFYNDEDECM